MYSRIIIVASLLFILAFPPSVAYAQNPVSINEVLVHPSAGGKEWVEFYVTDSSDIRNYWIDDDADFNADGGSPKKKLESVLQGNDSNHYFIEMSGSMFNNSEDMVVLFNASGAVVDQIKYTDGPGYDVTFGRTPNGTGGYFMLAGATRGSPNSGPRPTVTPTPQPTVKPTKAPTATKVPDEPEVAGTSTRNTPTSAGSRALRAPVSPTKVPVKISLTPKPSSTSAKQATKSAMPTAILGAKTTEGPTRIPLPSIPVKVQGASNTPALFTILGAGFIIACAVIVFIKKLRQHG